MKFYWMSLLVLMNGIAHAGQEGNGGDICENRFKLVQEDIKAWIAKGGASGLELPRGVGLPQYQSRMTKVISRAEISCTDSKIYIGNAEKTCKNYVDSKSIPKILCNYDRFLNTPESDQYVLVHHEDAGLSGFETNDGENSHYPISNQISGYLEDQVVKRLAVRAPQPVGSGISPGTHCMERIKRRGLEYVMGEAFKKKIQGAMVVFAKALGKNAKYSFGTPRFQEFKPQKSGSEIDEVYFKASVPVYFSMGGNSPVTELEAKVNDDFRFGIFVDKLGNPTACNVYNVYGLDSALINPLSGTLLMDRLMNYNGSNEVSIEDILK